MKYPNYIYNNKKYGIEFYNYDDKIIDEINNAIPYIK